MARKKHKGTQDDMVRAYEAAKAGKMSIREAAKKYNIPKSTLIDKVKGKSPLECKKGPKQILSVEEESALAKWGVKMASIGYTCTKSQIMYTVKTILDKDEKEGRGREKRFGPNNLPSKDWWNRFSERHKKMKEANGQAVDRARELTKSHAALRKWKSNFKKFARRHGVKDASCVYTCTANRFIVNEFRSLVKYCHFKRIQEDTTYLTVLTAASASGQFVPPMFVYPGEHPGVDLFEDDGIQGALFACSDNGDMTVEMFYSWVGNHLLEHTPEDKPVILLIESNWPYVDMYVSKLCKDKQVILYCLPPASSKFQHPLSLGFGRQLQSEWKMEAMNFELLNPGVKVNKYSFSSVFTNVWNHLASPDNITQAFERSGVWSTGASETKLNIVQSNHADLSCFDDEGNKIEVAMYEEVASEHPPQESTKTKSEIKVNDEKLVYVQAKTFAPHDILGHFEKAQDLSEAQRELFEARFSAEYEGQHDLVYNAWKALKELVVMKQDTAAEFEIKSDKDDEDSLLSWLSDEEEEESERENADDNGNRDENDNGDDGDGNVESEETGDDVDGNGENDDGDDDSGGDNEDEDEVSSLGSSFKDDLTSGESSSDGEAQSSSRTSPVGPSRGSSARTRMSPLKISRYVHGGEVSRRKRKSASNRKETKASKKRKSVKTEDT